MIQISDRSLWLVKAFRSVDRHARLRGWRRLGRWLFDPRQQLDYEFRAKFEGDLTYVGVASHYVDWFALLHGAYEEEVVQTIASFARRLTDAVYVDVGANVGHHVLFMAPHVQTVHAFEPWPELWPSIVRKIEANRLSNVILHRVGLGELDEYKTFYQPSDANTGAGSFIGNVRIGDHHPAITLPLKRGDCYFEQHGIPWVDIIKIDVEGYEAQVLRGAQRTLAKCRPLACVEMGPLNERVFDSLATLRKFMPPEYRFYGHMPCGRVLRRKALTELSEAMFMRARRWDGYNVLAAPAEKTLL